jgi:tetratricopeptide (TPR) repeat protein
LARINEAVQAAHEELKLQPEHPKSKALIRLVQNCPKGALQPLQNKLIQELFRMGIEFLSNGNPQRALIYFNEVLKDNPTLPNLYYALGTTHALIGTLYEARQACEIELNLQPEHTGAKILLTKIKQAINKYEQKDNQMVSSEKNIF